MSDGPETPSARTALIPTSYEIKLARGVVYYAKTQNAVANLLARYRVELIGLDGAKAVTALQSIQETAAEALQELRGKK